jgi:hypothetical protein
MKLNPKRNLTQPQTSKYIHPWYTYNDLKRPNPPSQEVKDKAQFKDKTYVWKHK